MVNLIKKGDFSQEKSEQLRKVNNKLNRMNQEFPYIQEFSYIVDGIEKKESGYYIHGEDISYGRNDSYSPKLELYVDDNIYIKIQKYPKCIRYYIGLGKNINALTLKIHIIFNGIFMEEEEKNISVVMYESGCVTSSGIELVEDPNEKIRIMCDVLSKKVIRKNCYDIKKDLTIEYKRMFAILKPFLDESMSWINSKAANLEPNNVLARKK